MTGGSIADHRRIHGGGDNSAKETVTWPLATIPCDSMGTFHRVKDFSTTGALRDGIKTDVPKDCEEPLLLGCRSHGGDEASDGGVRVQQPFSFVGWGRSSL